MALSTTIAERDPNRTVSEQATRELHKFGGSSLADVDCFLRVADIVRRHCGPNDLFVVSAAGKTTNRLIDFVNACGHDPCEANAILDALLEYQIELVAGLLTVTEQKHVSAVLRADVTWMRTHSELIVGAATRSQILGHGEIWSARLLSALLNQLGMQADWLDARNLLQAEEGPQPAIDEQASRPRVKTAVDGLASSRVVITGFMASNKLGATVLLGRNGSDYSATMIGILADASRITIWSDVAGVYTADPRRIKSATLLPNVSLQEANELARLGTPVLHRRSLQPVIEHQVEVAFRSSYDPDAQSTTVNLAVQSTGARIVTFLETVCLLEVTLPNRENLTESLSKLRQRLERVGLDPVVSRVNENDMSLAFVFQTSLAADAITSLRLAGCRVTSDTTFGMVSLVGVGAATSPDENDDILENIQANTKRTPRLVFRSEVSVSAIIDSESVDSVVSELHSAFCHLSRSPQAV